jgi:large subunit ribosomal protein L37Ae
MSKSSAAFGARYGSKPRKRYADTVKQIRVKYECPRCGRLSVKRASFGIWICGKCGYNFAGGAYTPFTKIGVASERVSAKPSTEQVASKNPK